MFDRLVRGRVVTPQARLDEGWIAISGEKIAQIGEGDAPPSAIVDDFGAALILPGIVDGQTHATSYKGLEGLGDTTRSALAGGVTTLIDMPYDNPLPLDRPARFAAKAEAISCYAQADVALYATVTDEVRLTHVAKLVEMGVVAFKISAFESSPTRFPRITTDLAFDLLEACAQNRLPVGLHNEDQELVHARMAALMASGADGIEAHSKARPPAAEHAATAQFLALGFAAHAHAHLVHISQKEGFDLVSALAGVGAAATGELCVHYLRFDAAEDGARLGARMKVNPPIRAGAIDGLWQAVVEGQVALISSDHSSWPIDNKLNHRIFDAGAGIPGLETLLPSFFTMAKARGLDAPALSAQMLAERPARFFGINHRKGTIAPAKEADLVILEEGCFPFDEAQTHDGLNWSPFHGEDFAVRVAATYLRGKPVWNGSQFLSQEGSGQLVTRGTAGWFA